MGEQEEIMRTLGRKSVSSIVKVVLDIAWYLTIVLGILLTLDVLVGLGGRSPGRLDLAVQFELDPAAYSIESEALSVESATIRQASGKLVFGSANGSLLIAYFGLVIVWLGAALLIIHQLRSVFRTLVAGQPFVRANAKSIRLIGAVVIAMEIARFFLLLAQSAFLRGSFTFEGLTLSVVPRPNLGAILFGLVVLVIAEVFRQGSELREEQELTV
jgi:hypothetical protein